jgi:GTP-binding protein
MNHVFHGYEPFKGEIPGRSRGSIVAFESGEAITYGLYNAQERGTLFIGAGVEVYEGMIVGESSRADDLDVNVCKRKQLTNTRSSGSDDSLKLTTPRAMSLEQSLEFINSDELVEVTPENIRMRKRVLNSGERKRTTSRNKK